MGYEYRPKVFMTYKDFLYEKIYVPDKVITEVISELGDDIIICIKYLSEVDQCSLLDRMFRISMRDFRILKVDDMHHDNMYRVMDKVKNVLYFTYIDLNDRSVFFVKKNDFLRIFLKLGDLSKKDADMICHMYDCENSMEFFNKYDGIRNGYKYGI